DSLATDEAGNRLCITQVRPHLLRDGAVVDVVVEEPGVERAIGPVAGDACWRNVLAGQPLPVALRLHDVGRARRIERTAFPAESVAEYLRMDAAHRVACRLEAVAQWFVLGTDRFCEIQCLPELWIPGIAWKQCTLHPGHLAPRAIRAGSWQVQQVQEFAIARDGHIRSGPVRGV